VSIEIDIMHLWPSPLADEAVRRFEVRWADDLLARSAPAPDETAQDVRSRLGFVFRHACSHNDPKTVAGAGLALQRAGALGASEWRQLAWALLTQDRFAEAREALETAADGSVDHGLLLAQALAGYGAFAEADAALDAAQIGLETGSPASQLEAAFGEFGRRPTLPHAIAGSHQASIDVQAHLKAGQQDLAVERARTFHQYRINLFRTLVQRATAETLTGWVQVRDHVASLLLLGHPDRAGERFCTALGSTLPQLKEALHLACAIAARWSPDRLPALLDAVSQLQGADKRRYMILIGQILAGEAPWTAATAIEPPSSDAMLTLAATLLARAGHPQPAIAMFGRLLGGRKSDETMRRELVWCSSVEAMGRIGLEPRPRAAPRRIFDLFPYNGELERLKIKLHEMAPWVERFVIVEAAQTFSGRPKPIHLPGQAAEIAEFMPKISHVVVSGFPEFATSAWAREYHQRDEAVAALKGACAPDDLVLISDTDEVVDRRAIEGFDGEFTVLKQDLFKYFYNYRRVEARTGRRGMLILMRARHLADYGPSMTRALLAQPLKPNRIEGAGWHFTSVDDVAAITHKLASYSHRENDHPDNAAIYTALLARLRAGELDRGWERCRIEELPAYVRQNRERLADWIL
jgi:hypothetical protein